MLEVSWIREAEKSYFFSGPATKRGGGGKALPLRKIPHKNVATKPLKKVTFLRFPSANMELQGQVRG